MYSDYIQTQLKKYKLEDIVTKLTLSEDDLMFYFTPLSQLDDKGRMIQISVSDKITNELFSMAEEARKEPKKAVWEEPEKVQQMPRKFY